ncbi:hypothetical protein FDECE_16630 [Fusarium decemcellulare]|nr:hypothetical protein FDECE_16630 [Fusarium decemcellulare]
MSDRRLTRWEEEVLAKGRRPLPQAPAVPLAGPGAVAGAQQAVPVVGDHNCLTASHLALIPTFQAFIHTDWVPVLVRSSDQSVSGPKWPGSHLGADREPACPY